MSRKVEICLEKVGDMPDLRDLWVQYAPHTSEFRVRCVNCPCILAVRCVFVCLFFGVFCSLRRQADALCINSGENLKIGQAEPRVIVFSSLPRPEKVYAALKRTSDEIVASDSSSCRNAQGEGEEYSGSKKSPVRWVSARREVCVQVDSYSVYFQHIRYVQ